MEEGQRKQAQRQKRMADVPNSQPKSKNVFQEILDEIEREKNRKAQANKPSYSRPEPASMSESTVTSEKKEWKFGVDELKTSRAAHKKHYKLFEPVNHDEEQSEADIIAEEFDIKRAVIYSEILKRPYAD